MVVLQDNFFPLIRLESYVILIIFLLYFFFFSLLNFLASSLTYPGERLAGIQQGEFVPPEAFDVLHHQGEVLGTLNTQLLVQRVQHVAHRRAGVVLEGLGLAVLEEDLEHVGHEGCGGLARVKIGRLQRGIKTGGYEWL